jgi:hypothetical protein
MALDEKHHKRYALKIFGNSYSGDKQQYKLNKIFYYTVPPISKILL